MIFLSVASQRCGKCIVMVGAVMLPSPPTEIIKQLNTGVDNSGDGPWTSGLLGPNRSRTLHFFFQFLCVSVMTFRNSSVLQCIVHIL